MILESKQNFVAYRCPGCGYAIYGVVGELPLACEMLKIKCQCGESHMDVTYTQDKKIRLSVPCVFCGKNHQYVVSPKVFFGEEPFLLSCHYTHMDIGFIGSKGQVDEAVERSGEELATLLAQMDVSSLEELRSSPDVDPEQIMTDAQVYDIVRFLVKELEADGEIDCPCHAGQYEFNVTDEGVCVFCPVCGAEHIFPADSVVAAEEFLSCTHLTLTPPEDGQ